MRLFQEVIFVGIVVAILKYRVESKGVKYERKEEKK